MMQESIFNGSGVVPEEIVRALRRLIRRARTTIVLRGVCAVAAVAIGSILTVMAIDATVTLFASWARWVLSSIAYVATAAAIGWFLVRPLARSFSLTGMARIIESRHPEMQERISSVVQILTSQDSPDLRGSEALIEALTQEAILDARIVKPKKEVTLRAAAPFLIAVAGLLVILGGLFAILPRQTAFLLARAAAPFANLPNMYAADLKVTPGDLVVGEGSRVQILVQVAKPSVTAARLRKSGSDGKEAVEDMPLTSSAPGQDRAFAVTFAAVKESFRYRVHAGDALSRYYTVRVVPPPAIAGVDLAIRPPSYSGLPPSVETDSAGAIRVLAGTVVDIVARINKPVTNVQVTLTTTSSSTNLPTAFAQRDDGQVVCVFQMNVTPGLAGLWSVHLTDEFGLSNPKFERTVQSIADLAPLVKILHLEQKEIRLNSMETLPVFYSAEDDFGISSVGLLLTVDGKAYEEPLVSTKGGAVPGKTVEAETAIDLANPRFKNAQRITFQVKASDNVPVASKGPQSGLSPAYTIVLDAAMPSFDEQVLNSQEQKLKQELQKAQQQLTAAKTIAQPLADAVAKEPKALSDNAVKQIEQVQTSLTAAEKTVRDVAEQVQDGFYGDMGDKLTALAEEHVSKAGDLADQIRLTDEPKEREKSARDAAAEVEASLLAVNDLLKEMEVTTPTVRRAVELSNLAERQDKLAEAKLAMDEAQGKTNAPATMTTDEWQKAQDKVADELAKLVKGAPGATNDATEAVQEQAADAAEQASQLSDDQEKIAEELKRLTALQLADKVLQELAKEQAVLAAQIKTNAILASQFEPMKRVAEAISANQLEKAIPGQAAIVTSLTNAVEQIKHPLLPAEQRKVSEAIAGLEKRQEDLRKKVSEQTEQRNKELQQIAGEQTKLAAEARANPLATAQADPMARAAETLKAEQPRQAVTQQEAIEKALTTAADALLHPLPTAQQQQDAQKVADLAKRQDELEKKVESLTEQRNKALQDLAVEQEKLAAEAKTNPVAAPQAKTLTRAAEEIKTDQPRKAVADQEGATKAIAAAADKVKQNPKATPQQQQDAQKAADIAKKEDDLKNKVAALTDQRNKALQELAGEQAKLAAEAMANPATANQFQPMSKAAEAIKADQPRTAMAQQEAAEKGLNAVEEQLKHPSPTDTQKQDAQKLAALEKKQEALRNKVDALTDQRAKTFQKLANEQEQLAKEAKVDPRTAPQADAMAKAAEAIKTEQPRQAVPQQEAVEKALTAAAEQMKQSPAPTPQQQQDAQTAADFARRQEEIRKKVAGLVDQEKKTLQDLATEQAKLAAEAKANPPTADQADEMARAAEALKSSQPEKAVPDQAAIEQALKNALEKLENPEPTAEQQKRAENATDLSKKQRDLEKQIEKAVEDGKKQLQAMAAEQGKLLAEAKSNPLAIPQAEAMKRAAEELNTEQPRKALANQEAAEKALTAAAQTMKQNPKATPAQQQLAERALDLAEEQADLRKEVVEFVQDRNQEMLDLAVDQQKLAEKAKLDPALAPQAAPMKRAADALNLDQPRNALRDQAAAEKGLATAAYQLEHPLPTPQEQQQAKKTEELLDRQEALRTKVADFAARDQGAFSAQRDEQINDIGEKQAELAKEAAQLADEVRSVQPQGDKIETHAAQAADAAATAFDQKDLAAAGRDAVKAGADFSQLADRLENAAQANLAAQEQRPDAAAALPEPMTGKLMALAERAGDMAEEQKQIAHEVLALATDKPVAALLEQQRTIAEQAADLSHLAEGLKERANDLGLPPQARQDATQGADNAARAVQNTAQASKLLQDLMAPSPPSSEIPPQAQQAILQAQSTAAQALDSASKALENVQRMLAQAAPPSAPPSENESLPSAYEEAREAAATQKPLDAMQAAEALDRAAQQAVQQAVALGANPNPTYPQTLASNGGSDPNRPVDGEAPAWGFTMGMKLRNWLNLQGELQDEVLQASDAEGPEEYRTLIKSYFHEVSKRGGNEP